MSHCQHFQVNGRVQGVGFRAATQRQAQTLGLTGWVRNDPKGFVEVHAYGLPSQLQDLATWLEQGPGSARVTRLDTGPVKLADDPSENAAAKQKQASFSAFVIR